MKKNIPEILLFLVGILFSILYIDASPVLFPVIPEKLAAIKKCSQSSAGKSPFFAPDETLTDDSLKKILSSAEISAKERVASIQCLRQTILKKEEKETFADLWIRYENIFNHMLELSLQQIHAADSDFTFQDKNRIKDFFLEKSKLYERLNRLTWEGITKDKWEPTEAETEFRAIYYALLYSRLKFFQSGSPALQKRLIQLF